MKDFHISRFSMIMPIPEKEEYALVNTVYGAYDIISGTEADLLNKDLTKLPKDTFEKLIRRGHITGDDEKRESENASLISRIVWMLPYRSITTLVVMPTYNCNFRCDYCYERKRLERGNEWLGHQMEPEVWEAILSQIDAYIAQKKLVKSIYLYGGEPLLSVNMPIVSRILDDCKSRGIKVVCVSNGYDLDKYIEAFKDVDLDFIQITVDGPKEIHDKRRYLAGGQGSYDRIMANVKKALEAGISIRMRTNINRKNLDSAMNLPEEYKKLGFLEYEGFHWYFKSTIGCFEDDAADAITDEEMFNKLIERGFSKEEAIKHCSQYSGIAYRVGSAFNGESYPLPHPAACGAESDMLVLDPDGKIYTCWDVVSMEEYIIGYTDLETKRFVFGFDFAKWRNRTADRIEDCRDCPMMMACGGGCAVEAMHAHDTMEKGFCGSYKEAFAEVVPRICYNRYEETGNAELSPSWYDLIAGITEEERDILKTTMSQKDTQDILKKHMKDAERIF